MAEIEVWRGGVAAWECDAMGHLNVGFYLARAMEGLAGLSAELGMPRAFAAQADATLMVREQYVRFLREARMNTPLAMTGGVLALGETDARLLFVLRHHDGGLAAVFQMVVAHVTARDTRPFPWSARTRARAADLATTVPEGGAPRSIDLAPVETRASVAQADALDLVRSGRGVVLAQHCDAFGRMRAEGFMSRMSDAMPNLFAARPRPAGDLPRERVGGAALEYRLLHHAWPRAGDRLELWSGFGGGDARVQRIFHWVLDPETGRPWATAQAISVSFDLQDRRIIALTDDQLAAARAGWNDALSY